MRPLVLLAALLLVPGGRVFAGDLLSEATGADAAVAAGMEDRVRLLVVHARDQDTDALAADVASLAALDQARTQAGSAPTGLTDDARYLAAGAARSRDARQAALEALLDARPDALIRRLAEDQLAADDGTTADRLLANDRHNRRATVVNDAVRPLGVFSGAAFLAALNPILLAGSALDSLGSTAMNLWHYDHLSTPEREALARYQSVLEREPETTDAPEFAHAIRHLDAKRAAALCEQTVALGVRALEGDDLDRAAFYLGSARRMESCAGPAAKPTEHLEAARARSAAREDAGRWPVDDAPLPASDDEARDYEALLTATALGDSGLMVERASRFAERHNDSPFRPSARYALAVGRDLAGHHDAARTALIALADGDSAAAHQAAAVLASPAYSGLEALREAERSHTRATARYVFLGEGVLDGRTALYGAAQVGAQGVAAAQSLGIFNVLGMLTRAWRAWRHDPVSNQAIIDRGEELLARDPHAAEAPDVHARLADAYARAGQYGRALMHYRAGPDPTPKRIAALESKVADEMLGAAEHTGDNPFLLQAITQRFPGTDAAGKASTMLRDHRPAGEIVLSREVLEANPALLGPDGLDLPPTLLDGVRANGELADAGVTLGAGELRLTLRNLERKGEHTEARPLAPAAYARARAAADDALYRGLLTAERRTADSGRYERYVPIYFQGEVGENGGIYVYPGIKMRRYETGDAKLFE
jgi:hypothetical protein